jgi:glycosyltransferase involved in cell wall biosynthesis
MASSLACIVTPNAGSIINDGIDGFIVPLNDVNALAEKILHLYKNRELIIQMGRAARETAVNHLTWKNYQKNMVRVYKDISGH